MKNVWEAVAAASVIAVPKAEIDRREQKWKRGRKKKKRRSLKDQSPAQSDNSLVSALSRASFGVGFGFVATPVEQARHVGRSIL
jgi:hypothetical protein